MGGISWSESYSCNIRAIDDDHKALFDVIDHLGDQINKETDKTVITSTIDSLILYVNEHFDREERFMRSANFPGFSEHKAQHTLFADSIYALRSLYHETPELIAPQRIFSFLVDWLAQHIQEVDREYIPFVKGHSPGDPDAIQDSVLLDITVRCSPERAEALDAVAAQFTPDDEESERLLICMEQILEERNAKSRNRALELFGIES